MAKKKVKALVKIQIPAGQATPAPPVGTALGPHGVAIMDFCKAYNAQTESSRGTIIPVEITIFEDRSFTFVTKTPPAPVLLRQAAGVDKASSNPGKEVGGKVTAAQIEAVANWRPDAAPRSGSPTSTPTTSPPPRRSSRSPPAPWASPSPRRSALPAGTRRRTARLDRDDLARRPSTTREPAMATGKKYSNATKRYDREALHGVTEALDLVKYLLSLDRSFPVVSAPAAAGASK